MATSERASFKAIRRSSSPLRDYWKTKGKEPSPHTILEDFPRDDWPQIMSEMMYWNSRFERNEPLRWPYRGSVLALESKQVVERLLDEGVDPIKQGTSFIKSFHCSLEAALKLNDQRIAGRMWAVCKQIHSNELENRLLELSLNESPAIAHTFFTALALELTYSRTPYPTVLSNAIRLGIPFRWFNSCFRVRDASRPELWAPAFEAAEEHWSVARHPTFVPAAHRAIFAVLCCAKRMRPRLPPELWLIVFEHTRRCDWVPRDLEDFL